ncbi:MAG: antibiotic transport system ATP-binding [Planctomycetota bacterium]|nr:MAG: antibiotic transport system ATP-binding [Planctomycetota bacterium]
MPPAIRTRNLTRIYRKSPKRGAPAAEFRAVDDVDLEIQPGELFGLLGPNGAGKTTLIKILCTLLFPTSGVAEVCGLDIVKDCERVREKINMVSGGEASGYGLLTIREQLWVFSQLYGLTTKEALSRIDRMLDQYGLAADAGTKINRLSTGMRQKMNLIRGFMTGPSVLFLDEPTLGLDAHIARQARGFIRDWMAEDRTRTILLTTHYLAEAQELCDRVAIIHQGRIRACDTPAALIAAHRGDAVFEVTLTGLDGQAERLRQDADMKVSRLDADVAAGRTTVRFTLPDDAALTGALSRMAALGGKIVNLSKHEVTLEDVFVKIAGQSIAEAEKSSE